MDSTNRLEVADVSASDGADAGCACCAAPAEGQVQAGAESAGEAAAAGSSVTATYGVDGMTCGHCVSAVSSELKALPEVIDVRVELAAGATSNVTVTSSAPLTDAQVAAALDEAGDYSLAGTSA